MKRWALIPFLVAGAASAGEPSSPSAVRLTILEPAFHDATVEPLPTSPVRFQIVLQRDMPTPGWKFTLDGVETDEQSGRIVARVTEHAPPGIAAQVITATPLTIPLEPLARRAYTLEVRLRRDAAGDHSPVQAMVLSAF